MDKDYICGCGKAYGSYPAFSTHRKTKHQNVTVPGTVMPAQQKAKRGRPSCDFKKVPDVDQTKKEYYQGLNIIQYGLLDLEEKYKGKILSQPHENNQSTLTLKPHNQQDSTQIEAFTTFLTLLTTHMKQQCSEITSNFLQQLINYGISTSQLNSIHLYNSFCLLKAKQLANSAMGIGFYIEICLLMSKWLCVMGYSKEILRVRGRNNQVQVNNQIVVS